MTSTFDLGARGAFTILAGGALLAGTACTVHTATPPPARAQVAASAEVNAEPVTVVPERIERYPHTVYQDGPAYYVDGRWYYRSRTRGWVVLRSEPVELARFRTSRYVESSVAVPPPVIVVHGSRAERVSAPPLGWEDSARVRFHGSDAYHVGGRWYYRTPQYGWVLLRDEPRELADWRRTSAAPPRVGGYLVERSARPRDVTRYPRTPFQGSYAYLIDGRWYYESPSTGWVVFREEPRELSRRRVELRSHRR